MRRHRKEDKRQRNIKIFIGIFVVFVMVFSTFSILVGNSSQSQLSYNGHEFRIDPDKRIYLMEDSDLFFYSHPSNVAFIPMDPGIIQLLQASQIVVLSMDPTKGSLPYIEQARFDLQNALGKNTVLAVTENVTNYSRQPVYTCTESMPFAPVIFFNLSDNDSINLQGNCIVVNSNNTDFLLMRDRLLYGYQGVIVDG